MQRYKVLFMHETGRNTIAVAERSKRRVWARSFIRIVGSKNAGSVDVCLL